MDDTVPIFSFVGRITLQKGVILILDAAESIINRCGGKINILVGGAGSIKDPYVQSCWKKIEYLRGKYPNSFWADPNEFFTGKSSSLYSRWTYHQPRIRFWINAKCFRARRYRPTRILYCRNSCSCL